jgi:mono/diheme cytochrome c family protein
MKWIVAALSLIALNALAAESTLEILAADRRLTLPQSQLLARRDIQTLLIADSVYGRQFTRFKAIPIANLFAGLTIPEQAVIQFNSADGFSANLEKTRLFDSDPKASKAYLAIEDPKNPWPQIRGGTTSAGPFYLVWMNPQASGIGREEWPYQIVSLNILSDAQSLFSSMYPAAAAASNVQNGFKSFKKNCFACHKMNGAGAASVGPDLNLPMSPTEYFEPQALISLTRDPTKVRTWPGMVMRGFSEEAISDAELADLVAYLSYMSTHKAKH